MENMKKPGVFPKQLKKTLLTCFWIVLAILIIRILNIEYLGFPEDKIPPYLKWLTIPKILLFYIIYLLGRYGWSGSNIEEAQDEWSKSLILLYQGIIRIVFIIVAILVIRLPYFDIMGYAMPEFNDYRAIPWIILWLIILGFSIKKDNFPGIVNTFIHEPVVKEFLANFIANTIVFLKNLWERSNTLSKIMFFVFVITILYFIFK